LASIEDGSIFIEESGTAILPNSKDDFFIVSFLYCIDPSLLRLMMRRCLTRLQIRGKYPYHLKELKFFLPLNYLKSNGYTQPQIDAFKSFMPLVRIQTLHLIREHCSGIFISILDKNTKKEITWTSEELGNFVIGQSLINDVIPQLSLRLPPTLYFDQGRLAAKNMRRFYDYLTRKDGYFEYKNYKKYNGNLSNFKEIDSLTEPCIWASDIIAGAFYNKYQNKDSRYSDILNAKLLRYGLRKYWNQD
jgi:hypothetical protein